METSSGLARPIFWLPGDTNGLLVYPGVKFKVRSIVIKVTSPNSIVNKYYWILVMDMDASDPYPPYHLVSI